MFNHIALVRWIKSKMPFWLKILMIRAYVLLEVALFVKLKRGTKKYGDQKKVFVLLSTDYSNLGDHAMTYAQIRFLQKELPEHEVVEVLVGDTLKELPNIKASLGPEDVVTLKGGGNVGVEYFREELIRRKIATYFGDARIVMFPQTVFFPDTKFGNREFRRSMRIYGSNPNFYFFVRDRFSQELVLPYIENLYLTPDIVLSLGSICGSRKRESYAMTCLRSDVEGIWSDADKRRIVDCLTRRFPAVIETDTIKDYRILTADREDELNEIWSTIAKARIIVTDRLHGMIFAALAGTPCLVLDTYNYKVRGQYQWLEPLNYIMMRGVNDGDYCDAIDLLSLVDAKPMNGDYYTDLFAPLAAVVTGEL